MVPKGGQVPRSVPAAGGGRRWKHKMFAGGPVREPLFYRFSLCPEEVHVARACMEGEIDRAPKLHVFFDEHVDRCFFRDDLAKPGRGPRAAGELPEGGSGGLKNPGETGKNGGFQAPPGGGVRVHEKGGPECSPP